MLNLIVKDIMWAIVEGLSQEWAMKERNRRVFSVDVHEKIEISGFLFSHSNDLFTMHPKNKNRKFHFYDCK